MRIQLSGTVTCDEYKWLYDWFGIPCITPGAVRQAINDNPDGETLTLEINSGGGSVFAGFEIYSALRSADCPTCAEVQSLAASAASTLIMGCGEIAVSPVAQIMLHQPSCDTFGNIDDHERSTEMLKSIRESILNGYALRCGDKCSRKKLGDLVDSESWITAQEAVEFGLADRVLWDDEGALGGESANSVGLGIRALITNATPGMTGPAALLAEYKRRVASGAPPAEGHPEAPKPIDNWQAKARLEIEKYRF